MSEDNETRLKDIRGALESISPDSDPYSADSNMRFLLARVDELVQKFGDEAYDHAACLSLAEGTPGWKEYVPTRLAGHAVKALRIECEAMKDAARALYYAAKWTADRAVDEAKLWEGLRDACGFTPGKSPTSTEAALTVEQLGWNGREQR